MLAFLSTLTVLALIVFFIVILAPPLDERWPK